MRNSITLCEKDEGTMTMENVTQHTNRKGLSQRSSWQFIWQFGSIALGVMILIGVSESGRTFASLLTAPHLRSELHLNMSLQPSSSQSQQAPGEHVARELELLRSIELGETAHAESLLATGVSANSKDLQGWTPLMMAALHNRLALIPKLYASGADSNTQNAKGTTALMLAANNGHAEMVQVLLARGAKVNARTTDGWTALMYAAWKGHVTITTDLLRAGADSSVTDSQHWTACMYAAWQGHTTTVATLFRTRPKDPLRIAERKRARVLADRQGHVEIVRLLDEIEKRS